MTECIKYLIVASVVLVPMFIMAHELSGDELAKSGMGIAMGAVVLAAIKMLENMKAKKK